jgi:WD40 repeat protein
MVMGAAFSPDGTLIATTGWDDAVKLWDAATGELRHTFPWSLGQPFGVAFSPDGKRIAVAGGQADRPGGVVVWDMMSGERLHTLRAHVGMAPNLAFSPDGISPDGTRIASTSEDGTLRIWDATPRVDPLPP